MKATDSTPKEQSRTVVSRLYVLLCGYECIPKSVSTRDQGERFILAEPISAYLIETEKGLVLLDTGVNSTILRDPELLYRYYTRHGWAAPIVLPQHEILFQLNEIGVSPKDVKWVILSHMHLDHTGNLKLFDRAEVLVQRLEYEYAFSPDHSPFWFDCDYDDPAINWTLIEGDLELFPGVEIISTPGHTPGHQSLVVELSHSGTFVLVADAGDLYENFEKEILPGVTVDDKAALDSIRRLGRVCEDRCGTIFYGHDPNFVQQIKLAPDSYR